MEVRKNQPMINEVRGTDGYMAIEMITGDGFISHKCDVYSAGVMLGVMIEDHLLSTPQLSDTILPYRKHDRFFGAPKNNHDILWDVCRHLKTRVNTISCSPLTRAAVDLLYSMTLEDPSERPTAEEALNHPFLTPVCR